MDVKIYKCFIASPGDTSGEREICEKVFVEINKSTGNIFKFRIESLKWENDTRPGFGDYSQAIINKQIGMDYDLFIGIMYKKFGTPTKKAGSGTEEEFDNAYEKILNKDNVEIMLYFNDEPPKKLSDIDTSQLAKVNSFKEKINNLGGYYFSYNGTENFETLLRKHLNSFFTEKYNNVNLSVDIEKSKKKDEILKIFEDRLRKALQIYSTQPIIWVDPLIHNNELSKNPDENYSNRVDISDLISNPKSTLIKAPTQFGLTSLSHHLVKRAWEEDKLWIYIDSSETKPHTIHNFVKNEVNQLKIDIDRVECIILDSWDIYEEGAIKKLKNLCDAHKNTPIFVMQRINDDKFFNNKDSEKIDREFITLHLMALPRAQVRKVVSEYNKAKDIGEEEVILAKVISDLDILNIHRTPFNCITLLKVSEKHFDESPVNRTNMLEMVLFILFNMDGIPKYRTKPDLKDCEYVLGRFCEYLIKKDNYRFSRNSFLEQLSFFCKEKLIDLEVDIVFDVLALNNIIIKNDLDFVFRFSYWIYYFAAKRMHNDPDFATYIFSSKQYIRFPEIIEFYTGIDRNRNNALKILTSDIKDTCNIVKDKVSLPDNIDPFASIEWKPTEEQIEKLQSEINQNVIESSLPEFVKDQYADRGYDQFRPYNQNIQQFFEEYSLHNLIQNIKASSRALRNSDYADSSLKKELLIEILKGWEQISNVLLALTPVLANEGMATFGGVSFILAGFEEDTFEEKIRGIILNNPFNVVSLFKEDLFSIKIGPLIYDQFYNEKNQIKKHHIALLLVLTRPRDWKKHIEEYIISVKKNSYYLYDIFQSLRMRYKYDFASTKELTDISYLIKMSLAKHTFGDKKPGLDKIIKIPNRIIPTRDSAGD